MASQIQFRCNNRPQSGEWKTISNKSVLVECEILQFQRNPEYGIHGKPWLSIIEP